MRPATAPPFGPVGRSYDRASDAAHVPPERFLRRLSVAGTAAHRALPTRRWSIGHMTVEQLIGTVERPVVSPAPVTRASTSSTGDDRRRRVRFPRTLAARATIVGVVAAALGYVGAGIPSYWGDEAASVMSAQRSWSSLALELGRIDAVHGLYYALLHAWIGV